MKPFIFWALRLIPALILLQTLWFKFSAAPESVYIFSTLHAEPWGRIGSGITELFAGILLLYRPLNWVGAGLGFGTMAGAILSHLGPLGIEVQDDGGQLFVMALVTWLCCGAILIQERAHIFGLFQMFIPTQQKI